MPPVVDTTESLPLDLSTLFGHHDAHPVVLHLVLLHQFGHQWLLWEPETLWAEIERVFTQEVNRPGWRVTVGEVNRNKIQAMKTLYTSSGFWEAWEVFLPVTTALNNVVPRFDVLQKPSISRMMAGVDMANLIRREGFMNDVPSFVAACALEEGVCWLPDPLSFANREINPKVYQCRECGNQDELDEDGYCDVCTERFTNEKNLDLKPDPTRTKLGHGKDLVVGYRYDWQPVRKRYLEFKDRAPEDLELDGDDSTDVQVAKLLVAKNYMNLRRAQMLEQKRSLGSWASI